MDGRLKLQTGKPPPAAKAQAQTQSRTTVTGRAGLPETSEEFSPWRTAQRPASCLPPQDNSFTVEDESICTSVEGLMYSFTISDPHQKGNPLVFVSPGFETLSGYSSDEMIGVNCKVLQSKATDKAKVLAIKDGLRERHFTSVELLNQRKDGRSFQNLLCIVPVLDTYDNLLQFVGLQCDLDEKRRREHDEHFTVKWPEQVRHYLTAFMLTDNRQEVAPVTAISPGFTQILGYSQMDMLGCSCLGIAGPDTNQKMMRKWIMSQWEDKPLACKLLCYHKDGAPKWCYIFSCPLTAVKGSVARQTLSVLMDITSTRLKRVGKYVMGKVIGSGAYGIVRIAKVSGTEEVVAIKSVDASRFRSIDEIEQIQEEMNVLSSLKHLHIIRLIEIHFINQVFFLVMEFAPGGSLTQHVRRHDHHRLSEPEAHRIFLQMTSAIDYCHRRRVIHRDLKPENILMDEHNNVKIADFGLAAVTGFGKGLTLQCGTPEFAAPEITTGKEYDGPLVDVWSMGVILYEVLVGSLPFQGPTQAALFKAIQRGRFPPLPVHISPACKDLIRGMLTVDAQQRLTMDEILRHPWCQPDSEMEVGVSQIRGEGLNLGSNTLDMALPPSLSGRLPLRSKSSRFTADGGEPGDSDAVGSNQRSFMRESSSQRGSLSGLVNSHSSTRLIITDVDEDDPIAAAIMRVQAATLSGSMSSSTAGDRDGLDSSSYPRQSLDLEGEADVVAVVKGAGTSPSWRTRRAGRQHGRESTPSRLTRGTDLGPTSRLGMLALRRTAGSSASQQPSLPPLGQGSGSGAQSIGGSTSAAGRRRTASEADRGGPPGATMLGTRPQPLGSVHGAAALGERGRLGSKAVNDLGQSVLSIPGRNLPPISMGGVISETSHRVQRAREQ